MAELNLAPTEKILYDYLADGEPHRIDDILRDLQEHISGLSALYVMAYKIRIKLANAGTNEEIICQSQGRYAAGYRRVMHIRSVQTVKT